MGNLMHFSALCSDCTKFNPYFIGDDVIGKNSDSREAKIWIEYLNSIPTQIKLE